MWMRNIWRIRACRGGRTRSIWLRTRRRVPGESMSMLFATVPLPADGATPARIAPTASVVPRWRSWRPAIPPARRRSSVNWPRRNASMTKVVPGKLSTRRCRLCSFVRLGAGERLPGADLNRPIRSLDRKKTGIEQNGRGRQHTGRVTPHGEKAFHGVECRQLSMSRNTTRKETDEGSLYTVLTTETK